MDGNLCPWDSPGKNTGVGRHFLLQGTFLTRGLLHCRQILYHLSHQGGHSCVHTYIPSTERYKRQNKASGCVKFIWGHLAGKATLQVSLGCLWTGLGVFPGPRLQPRAGSGRDSRAWGWAVSVNPAGRSWGRSLYLSVQCLWSRVLLRGKGLWRGDRSGQKGGENQPGCTNSTGTDTVKN